MLISKSNIGATCDIFRMNDNIVATGILSEVEEDYIVISNSNGSMSLITPQTMVKILVHKLDAQGEMYVGLAAGTKGQYLRLTRLQKFEIFDKREYFRLNVMIPTKIQLRTAQGNLTDNVIQVKVRDLSLRGVFFVAKDNTMVPGQQVDIVLPLSEAYTYTCTIRRKVDYYRSIGYGCSFEQLNNKQEDCLCSYLFEQQRKEILRAKNQMAQTLGAEVKK